jgi:hypothetical protein
MSTQLTLTLVPRREPSRQRPVLERLHQVLRRRGIVGITRHALR